MADAAPPSVHAVACGASSDLPTVTTDDSAVVYTPMATLISVHDVVEFVMSPTHDVGPNPIMPSDPGLHVGFGQTVCLQFDKAGTFNFLCTSHGFVGKIIVQ